MKQKEHHDEGRMKLREFKLNEVVLVRNWRRGAERWISGERYAHLPSSLWEPNTICLRGPFEDCSLYPVFNSWEVEEESNFVGNLLSSQAEVRSGLRSPSEPLASKSEAEGVPYAGDVEEHEATEATQESSLGDTLEGTSSSEAPSPPHPAPRFPSRERRLPRRLVCEM